MPVGLHRYGTIGPKGRLTNPLSPGPDMKAISADAEGTTLLHIFRGNRVGSIPLLAGAQTANAREARGGSRVVSSPLVAVPETTQPGLTLPRLQWPEKNGD